MSGEREYFQEGHELDERSKPFSRFAYIRLPSDDQIFFFKYLESLLDLIWSTSPQPHSTVFRCQYLGEI